MDYSAANTQIWNSIVQIGLIAAAILIANIIRRKVPFVRKTLMPTAVLAGFLMLIFKLVGLVKPDGEFLEYLTYHCIAIGFIALSLRVPDAPAKKGDLVGLKSGAIIVSSYVIQGLVGFGISLLLALTIMPDLFPACGALLPMGYGQGPGQANNIGTSYEMMGFAGGRSFGLALAAAGYICACVVGVIYLNILSKQGKVRSNRGSEVSGSVTLETFQTNEEIPIAESLDRFSVQAALVLVVYLITYLITWGITSLLTQYLPGVASMVNSLLWGFNFMIGSGFAILTRRIMSRLKKLNVMTRQYQNNYLLSRLSGLAFDIMIVAGIASIEIEDLSGLWLPFVLMAVLGGVITLIHLRIVCKSAYGDYYYEGLISMYGMMTGTISSGILLLREIDPEFKTPASNNLVVGSSFAILLGAPILLLVSFAAKSLITTAIAMLLCIPYYLILFYIAYHKKKDEK